MTKEVVLHGQAGGRSLPIQEFKFESFCPDPTICMIAKRGSGKSWVCRSIMKHFQHLPGGIIISPTEDMSCFYGNFFPDLFIHYEYEPSILQNLFSRQTSVIDKCKKYYKQKKKVDPRVFLIMDDCLADGGKWKKDPEIAKMFFNGRHYRIMFILTMQYPLGIGPNLRSNFDYIFVLFDDFFTNQKKLYEHYAGMFPSFDFFRQVFLQVTDDFGCMVIVNRGAKKNLIDKIFYYKADTVDMDMVGCKQFKKFAEYNFNPNYKELDKKFDITAFGPKSNKPNIAVKKIKHKNNDSDD